MDDDFYAAGLAAEDELAAELLTADLADDEPAEDLDDGLDGCCWCHDRPVCPDELHPPIPGGEP
jgi:hypothetical protein